MKNLTKVLLVVVSAVVLVSTVGVLTPRVVRAVTATLVQNVDSPGRNAWTETCSFIEPTPHAACYFTTPAGKEIVIQTVSFRGASDTSIDSVVLTLNIASGQIFSTWSNEIHKTILNVPPEINLPLPSDSNYYLSGSSTTLYVNPPVTPQAINITAYVNTASPRSANQLYGYVTLVGYTVNLGTT
jgi:hypothetical protein